MQNNAKPRSLNEADRRILDALSTNARPDVSAFAHTLDLSVEECHERLHRLEQDGYVLGYTFIPGFPDPGSRPIIHLLRLHTEAGHSGADVVRSLRFIPELLHFDVLAADHSILLRLLVEDEDRIAEIKSFLSTQLSVREVIDFPVEPTLEMMAIRTVSVLAPAPS